MLKKITLSFLVGLVISSSAIASDMNSGIAEIFANIDQQKSPGCNVGVIRDGALVHKAGYGMANLELDVPLDGNQVHRMASVSKQFTAMAVLLLAEEGKIDLDASIHTYLKELKKYDELVTVRSMLGHYSGMGDYGLIAGSYEGDKGEYAIELKSAAGGDFRLGNEDYLTINEFYNIVKKVPLALKPDQKFQYSNFAYFLLSMLVEEVSGKSIRDYSHQKIFKPLGMTNTFFSDDPVEIVKNRATGYKKNEDGEYITDMTNLFWVGDGGLHTNLEDLLKWDQNFYVPKVGKDPAILMELMNKPNSAHKSGSRAYANGQFVGESNGRKAYEHGGGWLGTSTYYIRYPKEMMSLILLCNEANVNTKDLKNEITELYFNVELSSSKN